MAPNMREVSTSSLMTYISLSSASHPHSHGHIILRLPLMRWVHYTYAHEENRKQSIINIFRLCNVHIHVRVCVLVDTHVHNYVVYEVFLNSM